MMVCMCHVPFYVPLFFINGILNGCVERIQAFTEDATTTSFGGIVKMSGPQRICFLV